MEKEQDVKADYLAGQTVMSHLDSIHNFSNLDCSHQNIPNSNCLAGDSTQDARCSGRLDGNNFNPSDQREVILDQNSAQVGVHLQFHMLQETLFSTVAILDR